MDRSEVARVLGVADADVLDVAEVEHGTVVTIRDGGRRLITGGDVFALDEHPASAHLRRWEAAAAPEAEPPAEEEPKAAAKPRTRSRRAS